AVRPPPAPPHRHDRPRHHGRHVAPRLRHRRRFPAVATARHRGHPWHPDLDGAVAHHPPRGPLLPEPRNRETGRTHPHPASLGPIATTHLPSCLTTRGNHPTHQLRVGKNS